MTELLEKQLLMVFGHTNLKKIPEHYLDYLIISVTCFCGMVSALPAEPAYCAECHTFTHSAYKDRHEQKH